VKRPILIVLLLVAAALGATMLYIARPDPGAAPALSERRPAGPSEEMMRAMDRMHEAMAKAPMTGDIDRDFVAMMVPHHQSAVEMARIYLRNGHDSELRRLSENIVASQEAEIRRMRGRFSAPADHSAPAAAPVGH
jgi:hypothetical protein